MRWLKNYLESINIPVQYYIFHQKQAIRRYITKKPKLEQNQELKEISLGIGKYSYNTINQWINDWYNRNKEWLSKKNEKEIILQEKENLIKKISSLKEEINSFELKRNYILEFSIFWNIWYYLVNHIHNNKECRYLRFYEIFTSTIIITAKGAIVPIFSDIRLIYTRLVDLTGIEPVYRSKAV